MSVKQEVKKMDNEIYFDELIRKIIKKWKIIVRVTVIVTLVMCFYGVLSNQRNYVYRTTIVFDETRYEDVSNTSNLVGKIFTSNDVLEETNKELLEKYCTILG